MNGSGNDMSPEALTKLNGLNLFDKVLYEDRQYTIRLINRNNGDLLCLPVLGGAQRWFTVDQVSLPVEES